MISFSRLGNYGRLGNQLFQYAFLRDHARRLGVSFYCPKWEGDSYFLLNDEAERAHTPEGIERTFDCVEAGYTEEAHQVGDGTDFVGYYQSDRYYSCRNAVRKWYTFRPEIVESALDGYEKLLENKLTSISLRLDDDYNSTRAFFPLYRKSYYRDALHQLEDIPGILVFSDRPDRAKEYVKDLGVTAPIHLVEGKTPAEQLFLMTQCQNNVVTNSTFTWWGAWLNQAAGRKVVAPAHWCRPGVPRPIAHILSDEWKLIPATIPVWDHLRFWQLRHPTSIIKGIQKKLLKTG